MGKKGHYPIQTRLDHKLEATIQGTNSSAEFHMINLDKSLAVLNKRLYRQNKVYTCKVNTNSMTDQLLHVFRLRDTWMLKNAYKLAKQVYDDSFKDAMKHISKSQIARWRDFKIDCRPNAETVPVQTVAYRYDQTLNALVSTTMSPDEYQPSTIYNSAGNGVIFGLGAANKNIITEYDKTGKVTTDPAETVSTAAYEDMISDLDDSEIQTLSTQGNAPPYDADDSDESQILEYVGSICVNQISGIQKLSTGWFEAPLGVVFIRGNQSSAGRVESDLGHFQVTVKEGDYKGVHAEDYV